MKGSKKNIVINNLLISYNFFFSSNKKNKNFIFLHGWGSEMNVWNKIASDLCELGFTCYSIDLPGFGTSQKPLETFKVLDYANIVKEFIKKLSLTNIVLVGHSFGGAVSIKLSTLGLPEIEKVVLVDSSGIRLKREKMALTALGAKIAKPIFAPTFMQPLRRIIYKIIGNEDYLDSGEMKGTYLNIIEEDLSPLLSQISIPVLIIWGDKDKDTPLWMAEQLIKEIRDSTLEVFKGVGHYSFLERPEDFKNLVLDFVK